MIDAHSAKSNRKSIFRFLLFELWLIVQKILRRHTGFFKCVTDQKQNRLKVVKFTAKMRNVLKRMKNKFSDLSDFYFRAMVIFVLKTVNFQ